MSRNIEEIKIPFKEQFRDAMLEGRKICTTRTKRYGEVGDIFEAFGAKFEIVGVCPSIALWVGNFLYKEEGFDCPAEFHKIWKRLHPRLASEVAVFVHFFQRCQLFSQPLTDEEELEGELAAMVSILCEDYYKARTEAERLGTQKFVTKTGTRELSTLLHQKIEEAVKQTLKEVGDRLRGYQKKGLVWAGELEEITTFCEQALSGDKGGE